MNRDSIVRALGESAQPSRYCRHLWRGISVAPVELAACACFPLRVPGTQSLEGPTMAKEDRGFASMDRMKQREIASKGGRAAHVKGTAHEWSAEEARVAGRKGGLASHRKRRPLPVV